MIEIVKHIKRVYPRFVVDVVGDGQDRKKFLKDAEQAKVISNFNIIGETNDVKKYYLNGDVLLQPSQYEGFGLAITEAIECGLPVVSFKTEGLSEIIQDGVNGFWVVKFDTLTFAERVCTLIVGDNLRKRMVQEVIERAKDFSVQTIIIQWESLYNAL